MAITLNNPRIGWHNLAVFGTLSADSEQDAYPASNMANPATYLMWRAAANVEQSVLVSLPEAEQIDYVGVYGHNWGSKNTTVHLEYSTNGGASWVAAAPPTIPDADDRVFFREFDAIVAADFRLRLVPSGELYDDPPEAVLLYVGRVLTVPRRIYVGHGPVNLNRSARTSTGLSESGQFLGRVLLSITNEAEFAIQNLEADWVYDEFDPFARSCIDRPFFLAWRPAAYPQGTALAWFQGSLPQPSNAKENGLMTVGFKVQGLILPPHLR